MGIRRRLERIVERFDNGASPCRVCGQPVATARGRIRWADRVTRSRVAAHAGSGRRGRRGRRSSRPVHRDEPSAIGLSSDDLGAPPAPAHVGAVGCGTGHRPVVYDERDVVGGQDFDDLGADCRAGRGQSPSAWRMAVWPWMTTPGCGSKTADGSSSSSRPSRSPALSRSAKRRISASGVARLVSAVVIQGSTIGRCQL
jgi:hypothetical protein